MLRLLVNSRLLVVKLWKSRKFYVDFQLRGGGYPSLFKGQLYIVPYEILRGSVPSAGEEVVFS